MSSATLIDFEEWRSSRFEPRKTNFASSLEMLALLRAFAFIEGAEARGEIVRAAQEAGGLAPPEDTA
jgi:hypothetical protein